MRIALLSIFLLMSFVGFSQSLSFEKVLVEEPANPAVDDIPAFNNIINSSNQAIRARWIREVNDLPNGWKSSICDSEPCNQSRIDSADFILPANSSLQITPHVFPNGTAGEAQITVRVIDLDDRSNNAVATFSFPSISSVKDPFSAGPRLYPNPATDQFSILSDESLSEITVTNMLGKLLKVLPGHSPSYDVSDLPNGIYLVSMKDSYGRIIKTLRFSKRSYRP